MAEGKRRILLGRGAAGGLGRGGVWLRSMRGRATRQIMKPHRSPACPPPAIADRIPVLVRAWMQPFRACFTAPVWQHVLVLVMGAVLAPGKRTVTAALRVMGLDALFQLDPLPSGAQPRPLEQPGGGPAFARAHRHDPARRRAGG